MNKKALQTALAERRLAVTLAVIAQAYVAFIWQIGESAQRWEWLLLLVALITAAALELMTITSALDRVQTVWSRLTLTLSGFGGVLIALDYFYDFGWLWLHGLYPLLAMVYALHLAHVSRVIDADMQQIAARERERAERLEEERRVHAAVEAEQIACPHCGSLQRNKQALYGHYRYCVAYQTLKKG